MLVAIIGNWGPETSVWRQGKAPGQRTIGEAGKPQAVGEGMSIGKSFRGRYCWGCLYKWGGCANRCRSSNMQGRVKRLLRTRQSRDAPLKKKEGKTRSAGNLDSKGGVDVWQNRASYEIFSEKDQRKRPIDLEWVQKTEQVSWEGGRKKFPSGRKRPGRGFIEETPPWEGS